MKRASAKRELLALETRAVELERIAPESKSELAGAIQRLTTLSWVAFSVATFAVAGMFWMLMKR